MRAEDADKDDDARRARDLQQLPCSLRRPLSDREYAFSREIDHNLNASTFSSQYPSNSSASAPSASSARPQRPSSSPPCRPHTHRTSSQQRENANHALGCPIAMCTLPEPVPTKDDRSVQPHYQNISIRNGPDDGHRGGPGEDMASMRL